MSKLIEFDLKLIHQGVQTRDGRVVTDVFINDPSAPYSAESVDEHNGEDFKQGISATIHNKNGRARYDFYHNGGSHKYGLETGADLFIKSA